VVGSASVSPRIETAVTVGTGFAVDWRVISEARMQILAAVIAGFGRAIAEVGPS
jgi:ABC-type tungstate transport system substrate-binding protein